MKKVRTTMRPDQEIEVSEQEYTDLKRQGLVHEQATPAKTQEKKA